MGASKNHQYRQSPDLWLGYCTAKEGQMNLWKYGQGLIGEIRLIESQFGFYTTYLTGHIKEIVLV